MYTPCTLIIHLYKSPSSDLKIWVDLGEKMWWLNKFIHKTHQKIHRVGGSTIMSVEWKMYIVCIWNEIVVKDDMQSIQETPTTLSDIFLNLKEIYQTAFESLVPIWLICLFQILSSDWIDNQSILSRTVPKSVETIWKPWIWVSCPQ